MTDATIRPATAAELKAFSFPANALEPVVTHDAEGTAICIGWSLPDFGPPPGRPPVAEPADGRR
jgi:hypothetical protein